MKVLIEDDSRGSNAWSYIKNGYCQSFAGCGHEVFLWDKFSKCPIDIFNELEPDLYWGTTYGLDRGLIKSISDRPNLRVYLTSSDWSKFSDEIDIVKYPIVRSSTKEVRLVDELNKKHPIDFLTVHYHQNSVSKTHHYWMEKLGIPVFGVPPGSDITQFTRGEYKDEFNSDIMFTGGFWGFKSQTIIPWFFPLLDSSLGLNVKIFGNRAWPCPQFAGFLPDQYVKHAMKSAKLCPNISEPHAQIFHNELSERPFKLLSNKCPVVSDYTGSLQEDIFNGGEIESAKTPVEFKEKCLAVINGDLKIDTQKGYDEVMSEHTYFSRVESIFTYLNLPLEAENVRNTYKKIRMENNL